MLDRGERPIKTEDKRGEVVIKTGSIMPVQIDELRRKEGVIMLRYNRREGEWDFDSGD